MAKRTTAPKAPATTAPKTPEPAKRPATLDFLWGTLLVLSILIAYIPSLNGRLVWDDAAHITRSDLQSLHGLYRIWFEFGATQQYYPLLHSAFWIEHRLWGDAVLGYHLTNIVLHAISAFLIVAIMRRLHLPGGWLAAFLFALHPVSVESVAWISEQKNTLSTALYLASVFLYLDFDRSRRTSRYALALAFYILAMLAKSVAATLPVTLLIVFWWERGKINWKRDAVPLLPWLSLGISAGALTSWVERTYIIGASGTRFNLTILDRCLLAGRVFWFYFAKLLWPAGLAFIYPHWKIDSGAAWQYLFPLSAIAVAAAFWIYAKRSRSPLAIFLAFTAALAPALGFVNVYPFIYSWVADHFQYQASIALIVGISATIAFALERYRPDLRRLAPAAVAVLVLILGFLTWQQSATYRDGETLYRETLARNPQCGMCDVNLALLVGMAPGHADEGIALTKKGIAIEPDFAQPWINLGNFYSDSGRLTEAMPNYRRAVEIAPDMENARVALANALLATGVTGEAESEYRTAIRLKPADPKAYAGLGDALLKQPGREQEALQNYRKAVELNPTDAKAHYELANALNKNPNALNEVIAEYEKALDLMPDYPEAHNNLGAAYARTPGGADKAIVQYREALQLKPNYAEAHYNLGTLLSDIPNHAQDAIAEYEAALKYKADYAEAHTNLGIALMDVPGRAEEAITHFQEAVKDDPKLAEAQYAWGMALANMPGHGAEAIAHFRAALQAQPDFAPAREVLTRLHAL